MSKTNFRGGHAVHRTVDRVPLRALMTLAMLAAAGLLVGACSGAAAGPAATDGELPGKPELSLTYIETSTGIEVSWSAPASKA